MYTKLENNSQSLIMDTELESNSQFYVSAFSKEQNFALPYGCIVRKIDSTTKTAC